MVHLRSLFELTYCKFLDDKNIKWYYELKLFKLSSGKGYLPDFYIFDEDINEWVWREVKGRWMKDSKKKFELFKQDYPNEKIEVIGTEQIMIIRKQMGEI